MRSVITLINDAQKSMAETGICEDEILSVHESTYNYALLMHTLMFILTFKLLAISQSGVRNIRKYAGIIGKFCGNCSKEYWVKSNVPRPTHYSYLLVATPYSCTCEGKITHYSYLLVATPYSCTCEGKITHYSYLLVATPYTCTCEGKITHYSYLLVATPYTCTCEGQITHY